MLSSKCFFGIFSNFLSFIEFLFQSVILFFKRIKIIHIVVTGGAGFIGFHLINRLLNAGHDITCVDNLITGCESNIRPFLKSKHFKFMKKDIIDINFLDFNTHIDQIYNLACPASPVKYQSDPIHTIKTNTIGIINNFGDS